MWLLKVFSVICFTACAAQDSSTETTTIYEPPLPSLQLHSDWPGVFPSEKVEFSCSVTGSVDWTFTWYRNTQRVEDSDPNVSLSAEGSKLTITSATQAHHGSYSCKAHHKTNGVITKSSNSIELTVYPNKPKPTLTRSSTFDKMFPGESITFTCKVDVPSGWVYLWYHKGTGEIQADTMNTYTIASIDHRNSGQYHCKAKRGKDPFYTEESDTTSLQVSDPPKPSLKLLSSWPDVFENETVMFSCEVDSTDWTFTWYRDQDVLQEDLQLEKLDSSLNITSIYKDYEGGYACKAHLQSRRVSSGFSNTVDVTVYENPPKPTVNKVLGFNPMYVGETVTLNCKVDVASGWKYQWFKDGIELSATTETNSINLALSGQRNYWCKATRGEISTDSEEIQQDVHEIPVPSLKLITPWFDVFPTESVKLSCGMDGSADWIYTWYKNTQEVQADDVVSVDSNGATLSIHSASAEHAGQYTCKGRLKGRSVTSIFSSGQTLSVYKMKPRITLTQDPEYKVMFPGESASFSCHINGSSGWTYMWSKDSAPLITAGSKYSLDSIKTTDRGAYACQAKRGSDQTFLTDSSQAIRLEVQGNQPKPLMTQQPDVEKVYIGESVSFECEVALSSGWGYQWFKDGTQLPITTSIFNIHDANLMNGGTFTCMAIRDKTMYKSQHSDGRILRVTEIPVPSLKLITPWFDVFPTESVKLSCGMDGSPDWIYTWYKNTQEVQADDVVSVDSNGATLSIHSASAEHAGQYTCQGRLKGRSVTSIFSSGRTLSVYKMKPRITLTQDPEYKVMFPGESVSFSCHINDSFGWTYMWSKDSAPLITNGSKYSLDSIKTTDRGAYACQAKRSSDQTFLTDSSQAIRLEVQGNQPKPLMTQQPDVEKVYIGEAVSFECIVARSSGWGYQWFKDGTQLPITTSIFNIHDANLTNGGTFTCMAIRDKTMYKSQHSDGRILRVAEIPVPSLTLITPWFDVFPTESVNMSCGMDGSPDWIYTWYKNKQEVQADDVVSVDSNGATLSIRSASAEHAGQYTCKGQLKGRSVTSIFSSGRTLSVHKRPQADIILLTGWSEVFSTDSLVLRCGVHGNQYMWNYTWFKEGQSVDLPPSEKHTVTPQNDPKQSMYTCRGIRTGRPSYSRSSDSFKTNNLLLKRRVLLSISGCIFFGIIAVFLGCIVLRVIRKPADDEEKPEEAELFLSMAQLKDRDDAGCPMVKYITDAELSASSKEADDNGTICSEATPLPITSQEDQVVTSESQDATETNGGLVSFK